MNKKNGLILIAVIAALALIFALAIWPRMNQKTEPAATEAPAEATEAPAEETEAPAEATEAPAEATEAPAEETEAPAEATEAPAEATEAPAEETEAPAEETEAPAEATEAPAENDQLARIKAAGKILIGTEGTWAPWTYRNEEDQLTGFDVEVARLIAGKLGVEAEFGECEWDNIFANIDSKRYDTAANGIEVTEERSEKYDFSKPYAYLRTALVVRGDNEEIKSFEDLKGKRTANSIASTYMMLAESYGATADGVDTLDETIQMLMSGRADATLNAELSILDYMKQHPEANLKIVALTEEASQVAMPIRKGEDGASLLEAINSAIDELSAEGALSKLSEEYFGADITSAE